jgi:hypothetical protein
MKDKEKELVEEKEPYFAEREEKAVFDYINSNSAEEKNKIYNQILLEPFRKMIQSILRKYPIHIGNYNMDEVESNALSHLIEHMIKYRPFIVEFNKFDTDKWTKMDVNYRFWYAEEAIKMLNSLIKEDKDNNYRIFNSKAFSYCQTIIRNFYKDWSKKSYTEKKVNLNFDDYVDEINENIEYTYEIETDTHLQLEKLIQTVIEKIEEKIDGDPAMKRNEIIVGDAIINVLRNWHILFMEDTPDGKYNKRITNKFAKNKILLFLKEQTDLSTKEIRIAIKPFKEIYFFEKTDYLDD